jgi:succinyl-diaminopimelate desuccinylase
MSGAVVSLDAHAPVGDLARALVDASSPSGQESNLADALEELFRQAPHLEVLRHGNTVAARTTQGTASRVVWAGHIDTVPSNGNESATVADGVLSGRGSVDMKSGVAIGLKLALELENPGVDVTWIFYDNEEVESSKNGLGLLGAAHPEWVVGDFAIVGEPSNGIIEGGCNGTVRVEVSTRGKRAHSARSWMGDNAIHRAQEILDRLVSYKPATIEVDGLAYREGMNAVGITGGVAGNVIPDLCTVTVNYRFAPNKSVDEAIAHVEKLFAGFDLTVVDCAPGARPGLNHPLVHEFVTSLGVEVAPKYGWTDVSRFGEWGIPALNYGPGDPSLAHADDERVEIAQIEACYQGLKDWLSSQGT